jgi:hypothetical protein
LPAISKIEIADNQNHTQNTIQNKAKGKQAGRRGLAECPALIGFLRRTRLI